MKEDKLGDLSMELSVEVLKLTKELRSKHETVISNQIAEAQRVFAQILLKANTLIATLILLQNLKLLSKKQMKQASGLKCFGEANI